jgi:hypothetical protein
MLLDTGTVEAGSQILEPACGDGAITRVLNEYGFSDVTAYDAETDFLRESREFQVVLTNPPFSLAQEFIRKAKQVAVEKIVFLLPLSYLHGKRRHDEIWTDESFPLKSVHVFTRYPLLGELLREDGSTNTGMMVYAWYVWERAYVGKPVIEWLDNNPYIVRRGGKLDSAEIID